MALALADFSSEIVDRVFRFQGMSVGVMNLWLTGNKRIQHKLATSVTRIKLVNREELVLLRLPSFIENLRALTELYINRGRKSLICYEDARRIIRNLSPSLRKIKCRFTNDGRLFFNDIWHSPPAWLEEGTTSAPQSEWSLKAAFPNLECLDCYMMPLISVEELPARISSLSVALPEEHDLAIKFVQSLPPHMTLLSVTDGPNFPELWPAFPRNLIELRHCSRLDNPDDITPEQLETLPPSLDKAVNVLPFYPRSSTLKSYPHHLSQFWLGGFSPSDTAPFIDFRAHFTSLREIMSWSIGFDCTPDILRTLPPTLTRMKARMDLSRIRANDWPATLTDVSIDPVIYPPNFSALPITLKHLTLYRPTRSINVVAFEDFSKLPQSLLSLTAICGAIDASDWSFPPNLTYLDLSSHQGRISWTQVDHVQFVPEDGEPAEDFNIAVYRHLKQLQVPATVSACFPFEKIPPSVTELRLGCAIPMSKLKLLPRRLKYLQTEEIFHDTDFHPDSQEEKDHVRALYDIGRAEGICDVSSNDLPPVSFMTLLPRTLTRLHFYGDSVAPKALEWCQFLPEGLKAFHLTTGTLPADFLLHTRLDHLHELVILVDAPTDEHIRALPRNLPVNLHICDASRLTKKALMYWPRGANPWTEEEITSRWLANLTNEISLHMNDEDPTYLRTLFSDDENVFPFDVLEKDPPAEAD